MGMNIPVRTIRYIDINDVMDQFCQLTGWGSTHHGIWNADFTKPVFEAKYPTNADGHVLGGESKYIYLLESPEDYLDYHWKNLDASVDSLKPFVVEKKYNHQRLGEMPYIEIELITIILWLMRKGELEIEGAIYHQEW